MRPRTSLRLAALLAAATTVTACGSDSGGGGSADDPASLRMTVWTANEDQLALFNEIADAYIADNPEVEKITFDPLPFDGYTTALTTQIAGGNAPDLAWIFENSAPDFVSSGALVPIETDGELVSATTELWEQDGELYAYPFSTSPFGMFVNTDLLQQAGQKTPAELIAAGQWTWNNAIAAGAGVNAATGKGGIVIRDFDYRLWDNLSTFWGGWGAEAWSEDGTECGFNQPAMVEAMTALHEGIFTDKAFPGPGTAADFFAGDAAMTVTQISRASLLEDGTFNWDLVPLPAGPAGEYSVFGQAGIGVLKLGNNTDAAEDFLAIMTNEENSAKLAAFFPPPRESLLTADALGAANPKLSEQQLQDVVIDGIASGTVKPNHTGQAAIDQQVRSGLDALWQPGADVNATLDNICSTIDPLLAQ